MTTQRVLATGATGLVGGAIVRALLARQRSVRILARNLEAARVLFGSTVEIAVGDLRDAKSLGGVCDGIDQMFHVAGAVDTHQHTHREMLETNVEGTRRLLEAARQRGVSRAVYTSSVSVYGDELPLGVDEDTPFNPASVYGVSKVRAEELVQEAVASGLQAMIVRPCIVYGPGDRYFLPQAARAMRLPVVPLPDGGRHIVDVVHADDLAAAHLIAMESGHPGAAYNVTDGGRHRTKELLGWIADVLQRSPWRPSMSRWLAKTIWPFVHVAGQLAKMPQLANIRWQDLKVFFSDYHFDISKITALGYVPHIEAPHGLRSAAQSRYSESDGSRS
ncbi:MAG TPA: NAD-dependent epimerase/dehydratase family protein [bacterium]|nr:NAD-dependent epimerase/dehydratase family protein [bacterium]